MKYNWKATKLMVPKEEKGRPTLAPYPDPMFSERTGTVEGVHLDDARQKIKAGEIDIPGGLMVRSVQAGPDGFVVYLVEAPAAKPKVRPKPRKRPRAKKT